MTEPDLNRIEVALNIKLPPDYREAVVDFPIRFDKGNSNSSLWDDADSLIRQNQDLRTTRTAKGWLGNTQEGWPNHFFFIGGDVELSFVLDLRQSPCRVQEIMHWDVSEYADPYTDAQLFKDWLDSYLNDVRKDDIDITSERQTTKPVPKGCIYAALGFLLTACIAGAVILLKNLFWGH